MRTSKSDTSLTDSFVIIPDARKRTLNSQNSLRPGMCENNFLLYSSINNNFMYILGFKWQRQLVFKSKLTMHTAYDRKDNTEPASITALAVSK